MKSIKYIIFLLLLIPTICLGANVYIDPTVGDGGDGSFGSPYNSWSDFAFNANNDYFQKCGTTSSRSSEILVNAITGTSGNKVILGAYYNDGGAVTSQDVGFSMVTCATRPIINNTTTTSGNTLRLESSPYFTIEYLDIRGGTRTVYVKNGSNYFLIDNCLIGKGVGAASVAATYGVSFYSANYAEVKNSTIDPDVLTYGQTPMDTGGYLLDGIQFYRSTNGSVHDNTISDWGHSQVEVDRDSTYINTYNNILTGSNSSYVRALNYTVNSNWGSFHDNTCIDNTVQNQILGSSYIKVYRNVFAHITHATRSAAGVDFDSHSYGPTYYNYVFNNTFYNFTGHAGTGVVMYSSTLEGIAYNKLINNIFQEASDTDGRSGYNNTVIFVFNYSQIHHNTFQNNIIYDKDTSDTVYYRSSSLKSVPADGGDSGWNIADSNNDTIIGNYGIDPNMVNPDNNNFNLQTNGIDQGTWLTTITSDPGSGATFLVADPYFFEAGMEIKTQGGTTGTVLSVNYSGSSVTLTTSISWTTGEGIALFYNGNLPDIGAMESGGPAPGPCENFNPGDATTGVDITTHLTFDYRDGETFDIRASEVSCAAALALETPTCDDDADGDCYPGAWTNNTVVYWNVHANTANQDFPSDSTCFSFTTVGTPPSVLSIVKNANGLTVIKNASGMTISK